MSCDFAVWHYDRRLSPKEALQRYVALCEDPSSFSGSSAAVDAFYAELTARYPEIDSLPEDKIESCPWSCALDHNPTSVVMPIVWSRASEVEAVIKSLAKKHGLVMYDPQSEKTIYPDTDAAKGSGGFFSRLFGKKS